MLNGAPDAAFEGSVPRLSGVTAAPTGKKAGTLLSNQAGSTLSYEQDTHGC